MLPPILPAPSATDLNACAQAGFDAVRRRDVRRADQLLRIVNAWLPEPDPKIEQLLHAVIRSAVAEDAPIPGALQIIREHDFPAFATQVTPLLEPVAGMAPAIGTVMELIGDDDSGLPATRAAILLPDAVDLRRHVLAEERWAALHVTPDGHVQAMPRPDALRLPRLDRAIVLASPYWTNWAHFLTEILPRVLMAAADPLSAQWPILISSRRLRQAERLATALLPAPRIFVPMEGRTRVTTARVVTSVAGVPFEYRGTAVPAAGDVQFHPAALHLVRDAYRRRPCADAPVAGRRLFVRRRSDIRRLLTESHVQRMLEARGFVTVVPEALDPHVQAALFAAADVIVGQAGAGMANMIFASAGCHVTVLTTPSVHVNQEYWPAMGAALGHTVQPFHGAAVPSAQHPAHYDLTVEPEALAAALDAAGVV